MSALLAGRFDPAGREPDLRLSEGERTTLLREGRLHLALVGPPPCASSLLVVFTGALDNRRELATVLECPAGAATESVLAAGYRRWGSELPGRIEGDFSLVVWDPQKQSGLIARDRLGVQGIYTHERSGALYFGSELRHLLACLPTRPAPDPAGVAHWAAGSTRPGIATLYEGVSRLAPASVILLGRGGHRSKAYWRPEYFVQGETTQEEEALRLRDGVSRAVARRIPETGHAGVLMSGGLDSAAVAAVAADVAPGRVSAYAGVFPEHPAVDESGLIALMRSRSRLGGIDAAVRPGGLLASAIEHLRAWGLPLLGWGDFWTLPLLRAAAAKGVTVTLGGDGGDELFAARSYLMADLLRSGRPRASARLLYRLPGAGKRPPRREALRLWLRHALAGSAPSWLAQATPTGSAPSWLSRSSARELRRSEDPHAWMRIDGPRWWAHPAHALCRGVEEVGIFEHQRHRAGLAGVTARHPLLDSDLVTLALSQPPLMSFDPDLSRPLLREAMCGLLPEEIRRRPGKAWFDQLILDCLTGPDAPVIRALLTSTGAAIREYTQHAGVLGALDDLHSADALRRFRAMRVVWRLVTLECWLRTQEDPAGASLPDPAQLTRVEIDLVDADDRRRCCAPTFSLPGRHT